MNGIQIYKGDSKSLTVDIIADVELSGYTPVMVVYDGEVSGTTIFSLTGTTISGVIGEQLTSFSITALQNNIPERVYFYQVYITSGQEKITVINDTYTIMPSK